MSEFKVLVDVKPIEVAPPTTAQARVEKLLHALKAELQSAWINGELSSQLSYRFYTPLFNPEQSLLCEVRTQMVERYSIPPEDKATPRLIEGARVSR